MHINLSKNVKRVYGVTIHSTHQSNENCLFTFFEFFFLTFFNKTQEIMVLKETMLLTYN